MVHIKEKKIAETIKNKSKKLSRPRGTWRDMTAEHNVVSWKEFWNRKMTLGGFPGGPVAKIPGSQCRGPGSIPGQGTRSQMQQLSSPAVTKTQCSQINKLKKKKKSA